MNNPENLRPDRADQPVVLVAEDDVMALNIIRVALERDGYFVLAAENGQDAARLSKYYPGEIHLLLSDIKMPKMSGIQLSKRIVKDRPGIRVLLMSAAFDEVNPGFPLMHKPFRTSQLIETVRGLMPARPKHKTA